MNPNQQFDQTNPSQPLPNQPPEQPLQQPQSISPQPQNVPTEQQVPGTTTPAQTVTPNQPNQWFQPTPAQVTTPQQPQPQNPSMPTPTSMPTPPSPATNTNGNSFFQAHKRLIIILGIVLAVLILLTYGFFRLKSDNTRSILRSYYDVYSDESGAEINTSDALYAALYYTAASKANFTSKSDLAKQSITTTTTSATNFSNLANGRWPVDGNVKAAGIAFGASASSAATLMQNFIDDAAAGVDITVGIKDLLDSDTNTPIRPYGDPASTVAARAAAQKTKATELRQQIANTTFKTQEVKALYDTYDTMLKAWEENRAAIEAAINAGDQSGASVKVSESYSIFDSKKINEKIDAVNIAIKSAVESQEFTALDKLYQASIQK